ncbi:acyl-CoA dehydrogenase family protein [Nocardioides hwasunensis]|uniref:Acyl-CoA dehydrogenase family protein n=1 Tax=Nocardioides hwasunensis TaxID=397258 RepID=A0ABR8MLZ2_9ACTN|nr:acyl-CoA dehydrogenase family protein [Nocardioides hwasunensis]MBD3917038.1 acyl-CoA dehydrogenase family protein [Nocardioides hwasunensis]
MDFSFSPEELKIRERAAEVARQVRPYAHQWDEQNRLTDELRAIMRDSGLARLMVPAAYGGETERLDPLAISLVREQLMSASSAADALFALQGIGSNAITTVGTEAQKAEWLPRIASMQALSAVALTEPQTGSDLRSITTTMTRDGDGYVINGAKSFISNAPYADVYAVLVREDDALSLVLVPKATPGVSFGETPDLVAPHVIGEVFFDGVRVTDADRLGEPGKGLEAALGTLAIFRVSVGAAAVGLAEGALALAVRHTQERQNKGKPLARVPAVGALLADAKIDLEQARWVTYYAAWSARQDPLKAISLTSLAKVAATEAADRVTDRCVQAMGRFGLIAGSDIERYAREARPMRIYEGANEVLRLTIARDLPGEYLP